MTHVAVPLRAVRSFMPPVSATGALFVTVMSSFFCILVRETRGDEGAPILNRTGDQVRAAVAANPWNDEYLVVWEDHFLGSRESPDICARRVAADGTRPGPIVQVAWDGTEARLAPDVVRNVLRGEYLVVWEQEWSANDHDIRCRRVAQDGTLIGSEKVVANPATYESAPSVSYDPLRDEYLVVWQQGSAYGADADIWARRLSAEGDALGDAFAVATNALDDSRPATACVQGKLGQFGLSTNVVNGAGTGGSNGFHLICWQRERPGGDYDVCARVVACDGTLPGAELAVSTRAYDQINPSVTYNPRADELLVVWEDHYEGSGNNWDIRGRRVSRQGNLVGEEVTLSWVDVTAADDRAYPKVVYEAQVGRYLVAYAFRDTSDGVGYRWLDDDAIPTGGEVVRAMTAHGPVRPAVAAGGGAAGTALVVWEDGRDYGTTAADLYGMQAVTSSPTVITFEEFIRQPDTVQNQYCIDGYRSRGVRFVDTGRIVRPTVPVASKDSALYNDFGVEFDENRKIQIAFTIGQSRVGMYVGQDEAMAYPVTATLTAYGDETPGTDLLDTATVELGNGPTGITNWIEVVSSRGGIRSVELECRGATPSQPAFEWIDDLSFSHRGPPCVTDTTAPVVEILTPATNGTVLRPGANRLALRATDAESGVASIRVELLKSDGSLATHWMVCGGANQAGCGAGQKVVEHDFEAWFPDSTRTIRVTAKDYEGQGGVATREVEIEALGPDFNLWIRAMEVTQGIQPWVGTQVYTRRARRPETWTYPEPPDGVPFVANRKTVVRVFAGVEDIPADDHVHDVYACLRCYRDQDYRYPGPGPDVIMPINGRASLSPSDVRWRENLEDSFTFVLPPSWRTEGTIFLEAEVFTLGTYREPESEVDAANRIRISRIQFRPVPDFLDMHRLYRGRIRLLPSGETVMPTEADMAASMDYIRKVFPIVETTVPSWIGKIWSCDVDMNMDSEERSQELLDLFRDNRISRSRGARQQHGHKVVYGMGIRHEVGCAGMGGYDGFCYFTAGAGDPRETIGAHEIGHGWSIRHPGPPPGHGNECGSGGGCEDDWAWPHGTFPSYGFDVFDMKVIVPGLTENDPHDFMSYGGKNNWISSRNWTRLYNFFAEESLAYRRRGVQPDEPCLLVRGRLTESESWELEPAYELKGVPDPPEQGLGDVFTIALRNAGGNVVYTHTFSMPPIHADNFAAMEANEVQPGFAELLPHPEQAATVILYDAHGGELDRLERSAAAPQTRMSSPDGNGFDMAGGAHVAWNATDADAGGALHAMVQYAARPNVGVEPIWETLAIDATGRTRQVADAYLPGGNACLVRLLVTDGMNTACVTSPPFAMPDAVPVASIIDPAKGAAIEQGSVLEFSGTANDREDGLLGDTALAWESSLDGALGTGRRVSASNLTVGVHLVRLTATDSVGQQGMVAVPVTVVAGINRQPIADAGPDTAAAVGVPIVLDGSRSLDPDGDPLSYAWTVTAFPSPPAFGLADPQTAHPAFAAVTPGVYVLQLVVDDGTCASAADEVIVQSTHLACNAYGVAGPHGSVTPSHSIVPLGSAVTFQCVADRYYHIAEVRTNGAVAPRQGGSWSNALTWEVYADSTCTVTFAENLTPHGVPEWWLAQHGLTNDTFAMEELLDRDGDGMAAWGEYAADTQPGDPDSFLGFTGVARTQDAVRIEWQGGETAWQFLERATRVEVGGEATKWLTIHTNRPPSPRTGNSFRDPVPGGMPAVYRLRATRGTE